MSDIIVLSDSSESISSTKHSEPDRRSREKRSHDDSDSTDTEFPEFRFEHAIPTNETLQLQQQNDFHTSPPINSARRHPRKTKESRSTSSSSDDPNSRKNSGKQKKRLNSSDSKKSSLEENRNLFDDEPKGKPAQKRGKGKQTEERAKRQEQLARERALRAIESRRSKNIKPGECMKFMKVVLDEGIENFSFSTHVKEALRNANVQYAINAQFVPNSITWNRNVEESYVDDNNEVCTVSKIQKADQAIVIWNWEKAVRKVADGSFCPSVSSIKTLLPDYNVTLVIFGVQDYFAHKRHGKSQSKSKGQKANASNQDLKSSPLITRQQLELCLTEVQIIAKCNSRLIDTPEDVGTVICQYTKAIAEIPYKSEKNKGFENKFDWYVMGDNRNTVKVDKDGNGLKRLWQQQLCQFNLSSLEIAEAICSVYPSPASLIEAYANCTQEEGMNLLRDIPIRRAAGPLTATRKIGLELSKKVYTMFTSEDGDVMLR